MFVGEGRRLDSGRVLVIGGNGFLGVNIVAELLGRGMDVAVLDIHPPREAAPGVQYYCGAVGDRELLAECVRGRQCIVYLKSSTTPATSMLDAAKAYCEDLPDLMATCQMCLQQGVRKIVFASSGGTVYGDLKIQRPYREDDPTHPRNHYGIAKVAAENILLMYNALHDMENIILRISNPYGKGQNSLSGVGAITAFAERIVHDEPIHIYGDGNIIRDYIEVSDVAGAFAAAVTLKPDCDSPVFNVGSGAGVSLLELVEILQKSMQRQATIEFFPRRQFDVLYNVLDISKAKAHLGFAPSILLEDGIGRHTARLKLKEKASDGF